MLEEIPSNFEFDRRLLKEIEEEFLEFLLNYEDIDEEGKPYAKYLEKIRGIVGLEDVRSIIVDFEDVVKYSEKLSEKILNNPDVALHAATSALRKAIKRVHAPLTETLSEKTIRKFYVRFRNIGQALRIRELTRADYINEFVNFKAIIVKATKIKELLKRAMFKCDVCGMEFPFEFQDKFSRPQFCPNINCDNTDPRKFTLLPTGQEFEEYQEITAQELPEELPPGQLPQGVNVVLRGDLTGKIRPGDRVKVFGILKVRPDRDLKPGKKPLFNIYIESTYVERESTDEEQLTLTDEEKRMIEELKKDKDLEKKIVQSIAPSIYGEDEIKKAVAALLFGGVPKVLPDGSKIRGTVNVLIVGDPGTGKSQILKYVAGLAPRAIYTSGKGASAAGLTAAVVKTDDEWTLEAGVLVLADRGIACLHPDSKVLVDGKYSQIEKLFNFKKSYKAVSNGETVDIQEESHNIVAFDLKNRNIVNAETVIIRRKPWDGYLLRIKFQSGNELTVTPDHLLVDGKTLTWRMAEEFEIGDTVVAPLKLPEIREKISILDIAPDEWDIILTGNDKRELRKIIMRKYGSLANFKKHHKDEYDSMFRKGVVKPSKLRQLLGELEHLEEWRQRTLTYKVHGEHEAFKGSTITPQIAYVIGAIYGNGKIISKDKKAKIIMQTKKEDRTKRKKLARLLESIFNVEEQNQGKYFEVTDEEITVSSRILSYLYEYLTKNELENAFKLDQESLKAFIAGALDFNESISTSKTPNDKIGSIEFRLAKGIRETRSFSLLLRRLGVLAITTNKASIRIPNRFAEKLMSSIERYSLRSRALLLKQKTRGSQLSNTLSSIRVPLRATVGGGAEKEEALVISQTREIESNLSAEKTLQTRTAEEDYFLDKIVSIEKVPYKGYVYDLYVPHHHNFTAEGVIVHNCIDEFDKMSADDRRALHEAMEQHSYHKDFEIMLANGTKVKIGEFVDNLIERNRSKVINGVDTEILPVNDVYVMAYDPVNKAVVPVRADRISRHIAPDKFVKITFSNGREITVTPEHPIVIWENGEMKIIRADRVTKRMIAIGVKHYDLLSDNSELLELMKKLEEQHIGIKDFAETLALTLVSKALNLKETQNIKDKLEALPLPESARNQLLKEARIPSIIYNLPIQGRETFLTVLAKHTYIEDKETLGFKLPTRELAEDLQDLLLTLGIQAEIKKENKENYKVAIVDKADARKLALIIEDEKLRNKIISASKRIKSSKHQSKMLPKDLQETLERILSKFNSKFSVNKGQKLVISSPEEIERSLREIEITLKEATSELTGGKQRNEALEREDAISTGKNMLAKTIKRQSAQSQASIELLQLKREISRLKRILKGNIRFIEITNVETVENKDSKWVYDITVEPFHLFISHGLVLHNTISIAKAGIVATLNARTSILAAANPKLGKYDENRSIAENINLPPTIISRFDLIFILKDKPDAEKDRRKARHILGLHSGDIRVEPPIPNALLKKYILYARENVFPKMTEEAAKKIEEFYLSMRTMYGQEGEEGINMPIAITTRQLEALVRLAEAHARMLLKEEVDESDAQFAIDLMKFSLEQVGRDPESGKIDVGVIDTGVSTSRRSKYYQVVEIIKNLSKEPEYKSGVPLKKILEIARERGIQEDFVMDVIRKESINGTIYEPRPGHYKPVFY